jgi:sporulation protein YlmC with PRC-barrel domain
MRVKSLLCRVLAAGIMVAALGAVTITEAKDKSGVLKASDLIGMKVEGTDGKNLGKIRDLVLDPEGDIQYAVLDFGGFLGVGDKYFAVPWDALQRTENGKKIALDTTKRDLKKAPGFDKNHWPDLGDRAQEVVIYEFYEVPLPPEGKKAGS